MRLDGLIAESGLYELALVVGVIGDQTVEVTSLTMDSRSVEPGAMFACVVGLESDGHQFAAAAVEAGAQSLVCEHRLDLPVPQVIVGSVRRTLGPLADGFNGHPSRALKVVGVTGTNGKTTTCALVSSMFEEFGWRSATIGTLTQQRTTPEAPELQGLLAAWRDSGGHALAMEVSSHALDQHRTDAVAFAAGVFTNLTPEHLDYHHSMEVYFEAKASLFTPGRVGVAVVNRDDPWGRTLIDRLGNSGPRHVAFSIDDASNVELGPGGTRFRWDGQDMELRIGGRFNVVNAVAAATCARELGIPSETIAEGLRNLDGIPGRFQSVEAGQPFSVIVDYAHTPDGLVQLLSAARELSSGRLIAVFGAGGDRDHEKRPLMGTAVARLADLAIVTSDNPRSEDPVAIIDEILSGAKGNANVVVEPDRAAAISAAVANARAGDIVVIAGKGHERRQEAGGRSLPFDDVETARSAVERILSSRRDEG